VPTVVGAGRLPPSTASEPRRRRPTGGSCRRPATGTIASAAVRESAHRRTVRSLGPSWPSICSGAVRSLRRCGACSTDAAASTHWRYAEACWHRGSPGHGSIRTGSTLCDGAGVYQARAPPAGLDLWPAHHHHREDHGAAVANAVASAAGSLPPHPRWEAQGANTSPRPMGTAVRAARLGPVIDDILSDPGLRFTSRNRTSPMAHSRAHDCPRHVRPPVPGRGGQSRRMPWLTQRGCSAGPGVCSSPATSP
jgi:hypothetical protein